jgi:hypothetical protein
MKHIGLVIEADNEEDFSALSFWLELKYGQILKLFPYFWTFESNDDVNDILDKCEEFLFNHKAICFKLDAKISITNNMANEL